MMIARVPGAFFIVSATALVTAEAQAQTSAATSAEQDRVLQSSGAEDPPGGSAAPDIVVTAQRREQRLQDVPVSVSVVTGAALQQSNIRTLQDITQRLPNVKITAGQSSESLNIRGIGSGQNPGFEQSVATFVDGIYRPRSRGVRAALFDIDQIEVLKGPQTTFFGANAVAGALNITTRKPGSQRAVNASALYGDHDEYSLEAGISLPIGGSSGVRVAGRANGMRDFVTNAAAERQGRLRELIGRVSLHLEPSDHFQSDIRVEALRTRDTTAFNGELLNCPPGPEYAFAFNIACTNAQADAAARGVPVDGRLNRRSNIVPGRFNLDYQEAGFTNSLSLGAYSLIGVTGLYRHENRFLQNLIPGPPIGPNNAGSLLIPGYENYRQFSQEIRLQSPSGGRFEFLVGAYYQYGKLRAENYADLRFAPIGAFLPPDNEAGYDATTLVAGFGQLRQKEETKSFFGAITLRPIEAVRLNGGLRYSIVDKEARRAFLLGASSGAFTTNDNFILAPASTQEQLRQITGGEFGPFTNPERRDTKLMPSASVQYDVARDIMIYASYANGFKAGGYGGTNLIEEFGPEEVDAYEVGLKAALLGRRLTLNLAAFRMDYRDLQEATIISLPSGQVLSITGNAASARSQGVELSSLLRISGNVTLSADVAYLDSKYRDYPNGACTALGQALDAACVQDLSGARRAFSPKWSGNFAASFLLPVADMQLRIDPSLYFSSRYNQQTNDDPLFLQSAYAKVDLRVSLSKPDTGIEFAIIGKNLTDRQTASFRSGASASPGSVIAFADRGASVAAQISFRY